MNSGDKHCEFSHFCKLDVEEPLLAGNLLSGPLVSGEGGYNWVEVCTVPETLSLFQNKICDFSLPYFRPDQKFHTIFQTYFTPVRIT